MENVTILSLYLVIVVVIGVISGIDSQRRTCRYTPTTVKGSKAPTGPICKGQLLLDERFTDFDRELWKHEITLGGGGVRVTHTHTHHKLINRIISFLIPFWFFP